MTVSISARAEAIPRWITIEARTERALPSMRPRLLLLFDWTLGLMSGLESLSESEGAERLHSGEPERRGMIVDRLGWFGGGLSRLGGLYVS